MKTALLRLNPSVCICNFKITIFMTFEVLMVVTVKSTIFWDAMPCSLINKLPVFWRNTGKLLADYTT
jgi:hypothetical protein